MSALTAARRRPLETMVASAALLLGLAACSSEPSPSCRGDETLLDGECVPWQEAPLSVDFDVEVDGTVVTCTVHPGGFPRQWVDALRFSFGDGVAGYGETISHDYAAAGIYPIDLTVRLRGHLVLHASKVAVVADGAPPEPKLELTLNRIPDYLNGTIPYDSDNGTPEPEDDYQAAFHLLVPRSGFTVDVSLLGRPDAEIDPATLVITADQPIGDGAIAAATDLAGKVSFERGPTDAVPRGAWTVTAADRFPTGMITLTAAAQDTLGERHEQSITFEVTELSADLDPFDRPMQWLLRFDMDEYTVAATDSGGVSATLGSDGVPDFRQELAAIGAQGSQSADGASTVRGRGAVGANAIFERWVIAEVITDFRRYFGIAPDGRPGAGIAMDFFAAGEPGAPDPADFSTAGTFSMMRFGGSLEGALGVSMFSVHNELRVDDTSPDLGVGTATIIDTLVKLPVIADRFLLIRPDASQGVPVGEHPLDATVLSDDFDRYDPASSAQANRRYDDLEVIARQLGMAIAAVAAHESGHAMGLVPNGAPPYGFFGDRADVSFIDPDNTDSHHVDFPFLNLMQAGGNPALILNDALEVLEVPSDFDLGDVVALLAVENRLSPYSLAYFQRALTYVTFDGPAAAAAQPVTVSD